jgi:carbonic anhydrase
MKNHYWETRQSITPEKALQFLQEGNQRFVSNLQYNHNLLQLVNETKDQQFPFAAILSCSDSRTAAELVFDQGLGDIFSIRLAGNIASVNAIGSMEYAVKFLGSKLIVVMGHTNCGAVKGACDGLRMTNLNEIFGLIQPAIDAETDTKEERNSHNKQFVKNVTYGNIEHNIKVILEKSQLISEMLQKGEIGITGAMYDVETGAVEFVPYEEQAKQKQDKVAEVV